MKKFIVLFSCWFCSFIISVSLLVAAATIYRPAKNRQVLGASINLVDNQTEIFSSLPQETPMIENKLVTGDARPEIIKNYLVKYSAPIELQQEVDFLVEKSDEFGVDPRLIVAVARKESTFCKNIAKLADGSSSNNCGGLGIYGTTLTSFSSIHDWIEAEIEFLSRAYISKGVTDTCEIEKTHTPSANGVWCNAINAYIEEMK